jgi:hypothetical protein
VWRSAEEFSRFAEEHVAPAARAAGIQPVIKVEPLDRRYLDYFHELSQVARDGKMGAPEEMRRVMTTYGLRPAS